MKLHFAEEITLLLLDDEDGQFIRVPGWSLQCAYAGAVLMDLSLKNRIDTDIRRLVLVDPTPVGDKILDSVLAQIAKATGPHDARYWIEQLADRSEEIRESALSSLIERGILRRQEDRFLWVFQARRYPAIDGKAEQEVKLRIMEVLFSDKIPDPRDVVIICLADACGIFERLLSSRELARASGRIEQVRKLDLIGQEVTKAIWDIEASLALAVQPHMY